MTSTVAAKIGSQLPRISHLPRGSGNSGVEAANLAEFAGLDLDPWQRWCLDGALTETPDRAWAAFEVAIIVGRQNGKGSILEARQLAGLFVLHERLQVHTAHEFKTCFEHFLRMSQLIESCPDLARRVKRIRRGAGEQAIELKSGERLRFLARSSGSGRGMSGDAVYLDEAFALTPQMMGALLPTLSARPNPQVWYTSSAPMSTSAVLHGVLKRGRDGSSDRLFYAEWGNDEATNIDDVEAWYRANPAMGIRIDEMSVRAELDALRSMPNEFERERLGIPEPLLGDEAREVKIPADKWSATLAPPTAAGVGEVTIAFDVSLDGEWSSIAIGAGSITDPYVEVIDHRQGVGWLPARLAELVERWEPIAVGCNGAGPTPAQVGPVLAAFRDAGISADTLQQMGASDYKAACGGFYSDVVEGRLHRPDGQGPLDNAAADATERRLGDAWAWDIRQATVPISPLIAATIARALLPVSAVIDPLLAVW